MIIYILMDVLNDKNGLMGNFQYLRV